MKCFFSGLVFVSLVSLGSSSALGETPTQQFWDSNRLVPVPLGKQDIKPGGLIVLQSNGTPLYYEPAEDSEKFPMRMDVPYMRSDADFELGVFAKIFGFSPSLKFKNISEITIEPAKLTGLQIRDGDVDSKLLPRGGHTATEKFLEDKKSYANVYIVTAVLNTAHMKITENQGRSIAFTSGPDVQGCTLPQPEVAAHDEAPAPVTGDAGTNPPVPEKVPTDADAAAKKAAAAAAAADRAKSNAAKNGGTPNPMTTATAPPGGGGSICQNHQGVVEVNTPDGVAVAMRVYRLWWADSDQSWNMVMDKYKDLPKF